MIFGTLPPFDTPLSTQTHEDIPPTHPLSRPVPLSSHPRTGLQGELHPKYGRFRENVKCAEDPAIFKRNQEKLATPGSHEGGLESGVWWELKDEDEEVGLNMIPVFADIVENTPTLLAQLHGDGVPAK